MEPLGLINSQLCFAPCVPVKVVMYTGVTCQNWKRQTVLHDLMPAFLTTPARLRNPLCGIRSLRACSVYHRDYFSRIISTPLKRRLSGLCEMVFCCAGKLSEHCAAIGIT